MYPKITQAYVPKEESSPLSRGRPKLRGLQKEEDTQTYQKYSTKYVKNAQNEKVGSDRGKNRTSGRSAEKVWKMCGKSAEILAKCGNLAKVRKKCGKSTEILAKCGNLAKVR